jgi:hypothetical protein
MINPILQVKAGLFVMACLTSSCVQVKEYKKSRLNDAEMALSNRKVEKNELNFQSYREAASGANAGKQAVAAAAINSL